MRLRALTYCIEENEDAHENKLACCDCVNIPKSNGSIDDLLQDDQHGHDQSSPQQRMHS